MKISFFIFILAFITITGCGKKDQTETLEKTSKPTSGYLTIGIDESLRPAMDPEIDMFSHYYENAHITPL